MIKIAGVGIALALCMPASAADKAIILDDKAQDEFLQAMDSARKSVPLVYVPAIGRLIDAFLNAPTVKERQDDGKPEAPK